MTEGALWHFAVLPLPDAAYNPFPPHGAMDVPVDSPLRWSAGQNTEAHHLYLGTTTNPPLIATLVDTSYVIVTGFFPDTLYYWRVDEINESGITEGTLWSFHTAPVSAADDRESALPTEFTLGPVYPNPFNATVTIPFALPSAGTITLTLWDIAGRRVADLAEGNFAAGTHRMTWSGENVGSGIYFVRLAALGKVATVKIVSLK